MMEGILKGFGRVPTVLSQIKEQTTACCCPSMVLSPEKDLNTWSNMMGVQLLPHSTNKAIQWMKVHGLYIYIYIYGIWIIFSFLPVFVTENQMFRRRFLAVTFYLHLSSPSTFEKLSQRCYFLYTLYIRDYAALDIIFISSASIVTLICSTAVKCHPAISASANDESIQFPFKTDIQPRPLWLSYCTVAPVGAWGFLVQVLKMWNVGWEVQGHFQSTVKCSFHFLFLFLTASCKLHVEHISTAHKKLTMITARRLNIH